MFVGSVVLTLALRGGHSSPCRMGRCLVALGWRSRTPLSDPAFHTPAAVRLCWAGRGWMPMV